MVGDDNASVLRDLAVLGALGLRLGCGAGHRVRLAPQRSAQTRVWAPREPKCNFPAQNCTPARLLRPWRTRRPMRKPEADHFGRRSLSGSIRQRWAAARES